MRRGATSSQRLVQLVTDLLSGHGWPYAVVFAVVALDGVIVVLPGETLVITASVLARHGSLSVWLAWAAREVQERGATS